MSPTQGRGRAPDRVCTDGFACLAPDCSCAPHLKGERASKPCKCGGNCKCGGKPVKLYLCGPMTGLPEFNFPAFNATAARLRGEGHTVINPAENDNGDTSKPWIYYMRQDIAHVLTVDALAVLPGWQASRGASLEVTVARALELPVLDAATLEPYSETVLQEGQRLVYGDRQGSYGHPAEDFGRTAQIWTAILGVPVTAKQAALCMVGVKISREVNKPGRDNRTDGAGYFAVVDRIQNRIDGTE